MTIDQREAKSDMLITKSLQAVLTTTKMVLNSENITD